MPIKRALIFSVAINLFFLALCLIFGDLKFGAIDDYFMAARLTGALGTEYNPHLIFVNAIYGYALLPLYHLFPKIGWYYIGEMFSVFLSFTVISYVLLQRCGERWGTILATLFTALFASDFYLVVQFTQCASILSAAGMLLFAYGVISEKKIMDCHAPDGARNDVWKKLQTAAPFILGIILMLWGSVMRWQAFLMGMPFFCICLLFMFKQCWANKQKTITGLVILFVSAFALHTFDQSIYKAPEYEAFNKFQGPRVALADNKSYNQNAVYEDAEEFGLSGNDFHMLTDWNFYDTQVFSVDSIKRYTDIITPYKDKIESWRIPRSLLNSLSNSLRSPMFWAWFTFCIIAYCTNRKKLFYLWCSFGAILSLMAYLMYIGRLVYRVESGFWLYAAVLAIPLMGQFKFTLPPKIIYAVLAIIALFNIYTYATSGEIVRNPSTGELKTLAIEDTTDYNKVFEYIDSQPDKIFLLSMNAFMRFSHHRNPPYLASPTGSYRNTISFGYWTPYLPEITATLKDYGITNPIKDVVHDNVIVLNEPHLVDFLQRHYYDSVAIDSINAIGEMTFYKYRLVHTEQKQSKEAE
ncbi:hypothetical protein [Fibrobacter sp. UWB11]|uniref:hypothetical protein n=1 Tax=Fibrobacter sp. UWB11 TaxID=1896202 RepID=UPI0009288739|nr:hypothetical protein [Fibrobacter sp. UWB11]SIN81374.1 hypothetical protein SAMN05720758_0004 [Fibrobacter sp. UWB11]